MKILKANTLSKILLVRLYKNFITDANETPEGGNIMHMFDGRISKGLLSTASDMLHQNGSISKANNENGTYTVVLQPRGREIAESWLEADDVDTVKYFKKGNEYLDQFEGLLPKTNDGIPASDRIVTLDDNDPKVKKARQALDRVAEEIRKNNNYAETEPADWGQRMAESEANKRLFAAPRISVETIKRVVLNSLHYLAKKFVDHAIGIAAATAIATIIALLG
jgi:hypothetical protein